MKYFFKSIRFFLSVAVLFVTSSFHFSSQYKTDEENLIETIVKEYTQQHDFIFGNPDKYELQIIYTQVNRDVNNKPSFKQYHYNLNSKKYFYAASMVKLPCSILALEKINNLKIKNLTKNSVMITDSSFVCQKKITTDTTALNKKPSLANYIKRMLLVSDDDAYGRIYEFLGQDYINNRLKEIGYKDIRIVHRFDTNCGQLANKYTNPIEFVDEKGNSIYKQPMQISQTKYTNPAGEIKRGKAYMNYKNKLVNEPKDFTNMNYLALQDIDDILKSIIFPDSQNSKFNLTKSDYTFLHKYLSMYPRESDYPKYDFKKYEDSYKKYLFYGTHHKKILNDSMRIFNIVGQSYGYLSDCAYIVNFDRRIEFFISVSIYVNADGVINDGKYDYKIIGLPFMADLGKAIYEFELKRKKQFLPDLSKFKLQ